MPRLEALLFDLDGTLLDSAPDIAQALNRMLTDDGRQTLSLDQVKGMIGDGVMELCRKALVATGGLATDDIYPYVQKHIAHYRSLPPDPRQVFPGVREALNELAKAGVKLGVCTNKSEGSTVAILTQLDLIRYFGFIAGGDTFQVHKPNPGHVTGVLEALAVGTAGAAFIGDGPNDVIASRRAGIPCIVVTHGYGQDYDALEADAMIPDISGMIPKLREMGFTWG